MHSTNASWNRGFAASSTCSVRARTASRICSRREGDKEEHAGAAQGGVAGGGGVIDPGGEEADAAGARAADVVAEGAGEEDARGGEPASVQEQVEARGHGALGQLQLADVGLGEGHGAGQRDRLPRRSPSGRWARPSPARGPRPRHRPGRCRRGRGAGRRRSPSRRATRPRPRPGRSLRRRRACPCRSGPPRTPGRPRSRRSGSGRDCRPRSHRWSPGRAGHRARRLVQARRHQPGQQVAAHEAADAGEEAGRAAKLQAQPSSARLEVLRPEVRRAERDGGQRLDARAR